MRSAAVVLVLCVALGVGAQDQSQSQYRAMSLSMQVAWASGYCYGVVAATDALRDDITQWQLMQLMYHLTQLDVERVMWQLNVVGDSEALRWYDRVLRDVSSEGGSK